VFATACFTSASAALVPTEWSHRQPLDVPRAGLVSVALPAAAFEHAQPNLEDLRVIDASGREVAYWLDGELARTSTPAAPSAWRSAAAFRRERAPEGTQLVIETGVAGVLDTVELQTSAPFFLLAAHVDVSADGQNWESLGAALPLFRHFGAEQLRLPLAHRKAAFVRVTLDDFRVRDVVFTGARVLPAPTAATAPEPVPVGAKLLRREEFAGETVLTLELDARHLPLAQLTFDVRDAVFMRRVAIAVRELAGEKTSERGIGGGTIYRIALPGAEPRAELTVPVTNPPGARELIVHLFNGDSPPLALDAVRAAMRPVHVRFVAQTGPHFLLTGNAQVDAPRYDLAAFAGELRRADAFALTAGVSEPTPDYRPRATLTESPLPDVPLLGGAIDASAWKYRRAVRIATPGVQELELDPAALARSGAEIADVRLVRDGHQVPYLLERPNLARALPVEPVAVADSKLPSVSLWRVALPFPRLPVQRVTLATDAPLFERQFRVFEKLADANGRASESTLASGTWLRTPTPGAPTTLTLDLNRTPATDTLWIETDNGDNPALPLAPVQLIYPVARLIFKIDQPDGLALLHGNAAATAPRYDVSLLAPKLLHAHRAIATLDAAGPPASEPLLARLSRLANGGAVFWAALAIVVIALLVTVARLLPKPPQK
jgi:hypothetical protein